MHPAVRPALLALIALAAMPVAAPAAAQMREDPKPMPSPRPTRAVARSGRLVTARTSTGGTQSYNCRKPENARRAICKGSARTPAVTPK